MPVAWTPYSCILFASLWLQDSTVFGNCFENQSLIPDQIVDKTVIKLLRQCTSGQWQKLCCLCVLKTKQNNVWSPVLFPTECVTMCAIWLGEQNQVDKQFPIFRSKGNSPDAYTPQDMVHDCFQWQVLHEVNWNRAAIEFGGGGLRVQPTAEDHYHHNYFYPTGLTSLSSNLWTILNIRAARWNEYCDYPDIYSLQYHSIQ